MYDTIVIGGGCTGYSAGMYAGRLNLKTLLLEGQRGGILSWAGMIENYPGYIAIDGTDLVEIMRKHALEYDVEIVEQFAQHVEKKGNHYIVTAGDKTYEGKTLIFATGTEIKKLNVPGEQELSGKGVHYCALCDGAFYRDKTVAVIGGSDSAGKDSLVLTQWAKKVYIIYRGKQIHPEPVNMKRIEANTKIEIINTTNITEIKGKEKVEGVVLDTPHDGKTELPLDGLFIAILVFASMRFMFTGSGWSCFPR